jgi:hypothetical protein
MLLGSWEAIQEDYQSSLRENWRRSCLAICTPLTYESQPDVLMPISTRCDLAQLLSALVRHFEAA